LPDFFAAIPGLTTNLTNYTNKSDKRKSSELSAPSGLAMSGKIYAPLFSGVELSVQLVRVAGALGG
jgi:hypothetical protein